MKVLRWFADLWAEFNPFRSHFSPGHCRNCGVECDDTLCKDCTLDLAW